MADNKIINVRIQQKYDSEKNWSTKNPVLLKGEQAFSSDKNNRYKVGDGVSTWSQLTYAKADLFKEDVTTALGYTPPTSNTWRGIQNNLTSDSTSDSLSAAQGKVLKGLVDGKAASGHTHDLSTMINGLSIGTDTPVDEDYYVCQYAGGGTTTTTYHRRSHSELYNYMKGKMDSVYAAKSHTHNSITDIGNSNATTFAYSKSGLGYEDFTWLAAWNGYELRAVNKSVFATAGHTHPCIHIANASGGSAGYLKIATIKISGFYQNAPFELTICRRNDITPTKISVIFVNVDGADPALSTIRVMGTTNAVWIYKSATSQWDIYTQKTEPYDATNVLSYYIPTYDSAISITWQDVFASSVPSGATQASWGYNIGYAESAGSVTWANVSGKPSTYPPSSHTHSYLPLSGGTLTGGLYFSGKGANCGVYAGPNDNVNGPGEALNNLVISSWYGVSFTTSCGNQTYSGKTAVGIDCREGIVKAARFDGSFNGNASSATALTSSAGSTTQPVYFSGGKPVACSYTLSKSVPSDAKFTDTNTWRGIQNNLTSDSTSDSLSAAQGKVLKGLVDGKAASGHTHDLSTMINGLSIGTDTPVDEDYYVCQYAGGGTTTTTYHRRSHSALYNYMKGKMDSVYAASSHTHTYLPLSGGTISGTVNTNGLCPNATKVHDIGSSSKRYNYLYVDQINACGSIGVFNDSSLSGEAIKMYSVSNNGTMYGSLRFSQKTSSSTSTITLLPNTSGTASVYIQLPHTAGIVQVSTSDARMKNNIKDAEVSDALSLINSIKLHSFDWRQNKKHQSIGFIADELEKLDNNLAVGNNNNELDENGLPLFPKCVNTFYLQGYEVKAIQELSQKNQQLENIIALLQKKLTELENKI